MRNSAIECDQKTIAKLAVSQSVAYRGLDVVSTVDEHKICYIFGERGDYRVQVGISLLQTRLDQHSPYQGDLPGKFRVKMIANRLPIDVDKPVKLPTLQIGNT